MKWYYFAESIPRKKTASKQFNTHFCIKLFSKRHLSAYKLRRIKTKISCYICAQNGKVRVSKFLHLWMYPKNESAKSRTSELAGYNSGVMNKWLWKASCCLQRRSLRTYSHQRPMKTDCKGGRREQLVNGKSVGCRRLLGAIKQQRRKNKTKYVKKYWTEQHEQLAEWPRLFMADSSNRKWNYVMSDCLTSVDTETKTVSSVTGPNDSWPSAGHRLTDVAIAIS